jgi:hypothetical protein
VRAEFPLTRTEEVVVKSLTFNLENDPYFMPFCSYLSSSHQTQQQTDYLYWKVMNKLQQALENPESHRAFGAGEMGVSVLELKRVVFDALQTIRDDLLRLRAHQ